MHSFRGGTGKSSTTANLAGIYAQSGLRVGVVDADIQSPGVHVLFGLAGDDINVAINDYLWGSTPLVETAIDVTAAAGADVPGSIHLVPSSTQPGEITQALRDGYDAQHFTQGLRDLVDDLGLDVLLIDTHPGLNEETLLSIVVSHTVAMVLRPDHQDYEGTGIAVEVARQLEVPNLKLIVNKAPMSLNPELLRTRVEEAYDAEAIGVIPHSDALMTLASEGLFIARNPDHELTKLYRTIGPALLT